MWGSLCLDLCFVPPIFLVQFIPEYLMSSIQVSSVQSLSHVRLFVTPWAEAFQASLSLTNSQSLLKLMSFESVMPSNHLILCRPLLLLPLIFPSIKVFSNDSVLHIGGQSIEVSASTSVLPMSIQDWFPLGLTDLISLLSKGLSRVFPNTTVQKHPFESKEKIPFSNAHYYYIESNWFIWEFTLHFLELVVFSKIL